MANTEQPRIRVSADAKPDVYDPVAKPEYFEGVLSRRIMAFLIDVIVIALPVVFATLFIALFGIVTLGLGWLLFWILPAAATIWAVLYYGFTLGSPRSATLGMRVMDLEMRTWYGSPAYFVLGAVHAVLYWISVSALTPLILIVALLNSRRRLLHDMVLGTVIVNNEARAQALRPAVRATVQTTPSQ